MCPGRVRELSPPVFASERHGSRERSSGRDRQPCHLCQWCGPILTRRRGLLDAPDDTVRLTSRRIRVRAHPDPKSGLAPMPAARPAATVKVCQVRTREAIKGGDDGYI